MKTIGCHIKYYASNTRSEIYRHTDAISIKPTMVWYIVVVCVAEAQYSVLICMLNDFRSTRATAPPSHIHTHTHSHTSRSNKNNKASSNWWLVAGHIVQLKSFCFVRLRLLFQLYFDPNQQLRMPNYFGHKRIAILYVHVPFFILSFTLWNVQWHAFVFIANCFNIRLV